MAKKTPPAKPVPVPGKIPENPPPYNPEEFIPATNDSDIIPEEDSWDNPNPIDKPATDAGT